MPAIGVHHTDTVDEEWDGPGAVANMPAEKDTLTYCHAWYDPEGDRDAKATYKMPHHRGKDGPANLNACRNGLARLENSTIPDGDKEKVRKHLQAHLDDAGSGDSGEGGKNRARLIPEQRPSNRHRSPVSNRTGKDGWYSIKNRVVAPSGETTAEIYIYDEIGWFGVTAQEFIDELRHLDVDVLQVHINSPGGDVFDSIAIYNALAGYPGRVDVIVDSLAASGGSIIAMAGDTVTMAAHSQLMIHDAWGLCIGNAADMTDTASMLAKQSDNVAAVYAGRAGGEVADWRAVMEGEAWYTAQEAVDAGLADAVREPKKRAAEPGSNPENRWDLSVFTFAGRSHAPSPPMPTARTSAGSTQESTKEGDVVSTLAEDLRQRLGITDAAASEETILKALDEVLAEQVEGTTSTSTEGGGAAASGQGEPATGGQQVAVEQPAATETGPQQGAPAEQAPVAASAGNPTVPDLPEGMVVIDSATLDQLKAGAQRGNEIWQQNENAQRRAVVENAINDGQLPPARREFWVSYMERDPEGAQAFLAQIPKNSIPVAELGHGQSPQAKQVDDAWFDSVPAPKHTQTGA